VEGTGEGVEGERSGGREGGREEGRAAVPHLAVLHEDGAKAAARAVLETLLKIDGKGGKEGGREGGRDNRVRGCGDGGGTRFPVR